MRCSLVLAAMLVLFCGVAQAQPWYDKDPNDKILHFVGGATIEAGLSIVATKVGSEYGPEIGLAGAIAFGLTKESTDKNFDPYDFAAASGGGLVAYLIDKWIRSTGSSAPAKFAAGPAKGGAFASVVGRF